MFKIIGADQKEYGPISVEQIRQWIRDGRLNPTTPAQREGATDWQQLSAYSEFADLFQIAPTASPTATYAPSAAPGVMPSGPVYDAASGIKGPAIALIVVAVLGIAYHLFEAFAVLLFRGASMATNMPPNMPPETQHLIEMIQGPLGAAVYLIAAAVSGFLLFGSIKMLKLQSHTLAMVTCIVALLPCGCCCVFSLPFGIWGLVMLNRPGVKSQFS